MFCNCLVKVINYIRNEAIYGSQAHRSDPLIFCVVVPSQNAYASANVFQKAYNIMFPKSVTASFTQNDCAHWAGARVNAAHCSDVSIFSNICLDVLSIFEHLCSTQTVSIL